MDSGRLRYEYTHEVVPTIIAAPNGAGTRRLYAFRGSQFPAGRRLSLMLRDQYAGGRNASPPPP